MSLLDYFSMTRVINLPERRDRRREITDELQRAGMPFSHERIEIFPAVRCVERRGFPSTGVRGCFLSHLSVLKEAHRRGAERVLIMEDDLAISPILGECWREIVEMLEQQPWDFTYFGYNENDVVTAATQGLLVPCHDALGTAHFYAVHGRIVPTLIRYLERVQERPFGHPEGGPMHYDGALTMFRASHPEAVTLRVQPCLGTQRSSRSDIYVRWFERVPGLRQISEWLRFLKKKIRPKRRQEVEIAA